MSLVLSFGYQGWWTYGQVAPMIVSILGLPWIGGSKSSQDITIRVCFKFNANRNSWLASASNCVHCIPSYRTKPNSVQQPGFLGIWVFPYFPLFSAANQRCFNVGSFFCKRPKWIFHYPCRFTSRLSAFAKALPLCRTSHFSYLIRARKNPSLLLFHPLLCLRLGSYACFHHLSLLFLNTAPCKWKISSNH